jgi:hypothetical protein
MKPLLTLCLAIFAISTFAQIAQLKVESKIEKVTLFSQGAQVERKAQTQVPKGKTELIFGGISPNIDKQSIQIKGTGHFSILTVAQQSNKLEEQERREEVSKLEKRQSQILQQKKLEQSTLAVFNNEKTILERNQSIGGNAGIKTADLKEAVDFQRARMTEVLNKQLELEEKIADLDSTLKKISLQLKVLKQMEDLSTTDLLVTISAEQVTQAEFNLSYLVNDAGWFASYDVRVTDISKPIDLTMKANIFQQSGEDWKEVKMVISNGNPSENGVVPNLLAWVLKYEYPMPQLYGYRDYGGISSFAGQEISGVVCDQDGEVLVGANILVMGTTVGTITDEQGHFTLQLPQGATRLDVSYVGYTSKQVPVNAKFLNLSLTEGLMLNEVMVVGKELEGKAAGLKIRGAASVDNDKDAFEPKEIFQPTTFRYELEIPYTVLSNGKSYSLELKKRSVPAMYEYRTVPKLDQAAYLGAKITNWQELNLLDGEASLFFEGAFLGKTIFDLKHAPDTLSLSLGKDQSIVVSREKLKTFSSKKFLGNERIESRAFEIAVRNNKAQHIDIVVEDQIPISSLKEISVKDTEYSGAVLDEQKGKLTWRYSIPARQTQKMQLKYRVEYPKNRGLTLE